MRSAAIIHNELSAAAAALGRKGGLARSEAKARAVRENGRRGGRPRHAETAARHEAADKACGRDWECTCSACHLARKDELDRILRGNNGQWSARAELLSQQILALEKARANKQPQPQQEKDRE